MCYETYLLLCLFIFGRFGIMNIDWSLKEKDVNQFCFQLVDIFSVKYLIFTDCLSIWTATEKQTGGLKQITSSVRLNRNQPWEREFVSFYVAKILSRYKIIFKWEEELRRNKEFIKSTHFKYYCLSQVEEKEPPNDKLRDFPKKNISYGEELWKVR